MGHFEFRFFIGDPTFFENDKVAGAGAVSPPPKAAGSQGREDDKVAGIDKVAKITPPT